MAVLTPEGLGVRGKGRLRLRPQALTLLWGLVAAWLPSAGIRGPPDCDMGPALGSSLTGGLWGVGTLRERRTYSLRLPPLLSAEQAPGPLPGTPAGEAELKPFRPFSDIVSSTLQEKGSSGL